MATVAIERWVVVGSIALVAACAGPGPKRGEIVDASRREPAVEAIDGGQQADRVGVGHRHVASDAAEAQARLLRNKGLGSVAALESGVPRSPRARPKASADSTDLVMLAAKPIDTMRVHSLPVGAGSCHLVECPGTSEGFMLIDCGSTEASIAPFDSQRAATYVRQVVGTSKVAVVVSHGDLDHYAYIPTVVPAEKVSTLWLGGELEAYNARFLRWVTEVRDMGSATNPIVFDELPVNWHNDGESVGPLGCGTALSYVLGVNSGVSKNDHSLMLSVDHGDFRVIFAGDATGKSQDAAIANYPGGLLASAVVMASHHGASSYRSNDPAWISHVQPEYVVYSAGESHAHPRCDVVDDYRSGRTLRSVAEHGFRCGTAQGYKPSERSRLAEYSTYASGVVVITSDEAMSDPRVACIPGPC